MSETDEAVKQEEKQERERRRKIHRTEVLRMNNAKITRTQFNTVLNKLNHKKYTKVCCSTNQQSKKLASVTHFIAYVAVITPEPIKSNLFNVNDADSIFRSIINNQVSFFAIRKGTGTNIVMDNTQAIHQKLFEDKMSNYVGMIIEHEKNKFTPLSKPEHAYACSNNLQTKTGYMHAILNSQVQWHPKSKTYSLKKTHSIFKGFNRAIKEYFKHPIYSCTSVFNTANNWRQAKKRLINLLVAKENLAIMLPTGSPCKKSDASIKVIHGICKIHPRQTSLLTSMANEKKLQTINNNRFIQQIIAYDNSNLLFVGKHNESARLAFLHMHATAKDCAKIKNETSDPDDTADYWLAATSNLPDMMKWIKQYMEVNNKQKFLYNIYCVTSRMYIAFLPPSSSNNTLKNAYPLVLAYVYPNGFHYKYRINKPYIALGSKHVKLIGKVYPYMNTEFSGQPNSQLQYTAGMFKGQAKSLDCFSGSDTRQAALKSNPAFQNYIANQ